MVRQKVRRPKDIRDRVAAWMVWVFLASCVPHLVAYTIRMRSQQSFTPDLLPIIASGQLFITAIGWLIGSMRELNSETSELATSHRSLITGVAIFSLLIASAFYGVAVSPLSASYIPSRFDQLLTGLGSAVSCVMALTLSVWTVVANTQKKQLQGKSDPT